ncbi:hypothetical protein B0H14DRAFT_2574015 [Mycena olivaceomarginata]|nr:hypothetical protein B0H14DRAFT_2574015 [Mycena olivaceomarginata]
MVKTLLPLYFIVVPGCIAFSSDSWVVELPTSPFVCSMPSLIPIKSSTNKVKQFSIKGLILGHPFYLQSRIRSVENSGPHDDLKPQRFSRRKSCLSRSCKHPLRRVHTSGATTQDSPRRKVLLILLELKQAFTEAVISQVQAAEKHTECIEFRGTYIHHIRAIHWQRAEFDRTPRSARGSSIARAGSLVLPPDAMRKRLVRLGQGPGENAAALPRQSRMLTKR